MSRNYDNWERLVAAVLKRDQIWQLCHQDSISICSDSSSMSYLDLSFPVSLGSFGIAAADISQVENSNLATLPQHVQEYFGRGPKAFIKLLDVVDVAEREFEEQMASLRSCWHENVVIPWAYYSSEATKLVVYEYDYYTQGSVYDMLQGNGNTRPRWEIRARIALGAARGIAHIHGGNLVHGNIDSSNIYLNEQLYGCVSVLGLKSGRILLQKKDVYSFGLLLLELVTRKAQAPEIVHRLRLFEPDEWNINCFRERGLYVDESDLYWKPIREFPFVDSELKLNDPSVHQELCKALRVAKRCLAIIPQDRPTMSEVVSMLHHDKTEFISPTSLKKPVWRRFLPFNR